MLGNPPEKVQRPLGSTILRGARSCGDTTGLSNPGKRWFQSTGVPNNIHLGKKSRPLARLLVEFTEECGSLKGSQPGLSTNRENIQVGFSKTQLKIWQRKVLTIWGKGWGTGS